MALENKLGLTSSADLAREEERISKKKAAELFERGILDNLPVGSRTDYMHRGSIQAALVADDTAHIQHIHCNEHHITKI